MQRKAVNHSAERICTASEMRSIDSMTVDTTGIKGIVLMENAAVACVGEIEKRFDIKNTSFAVFCGKGNNGGDGFAIARHLFNKGGKVYVYLTAGSEFSDDTLTNYKIIRTLGITVIDIEDEEYLKNFVDSADCVIDAVLGTGISGTPKGMAQATISAINKYAKFVMSVDIPSGVDATTGEVFGDAVKADLTVTFGAYKRGMFLYPGADFVGELVLKDISIPNLIWELKGGNCFLTSKEGVWEVFPKRCNNSHKGTYGKLMIVGGSVGMAGAVTMAAASALRCGVGLVTSAVPVSVNNIVQQRLEEVMTIPLPEEGGRLVPTTAERLARRANLCDAVLLGNGMGRSENICEFVREFLTRLSVPVVIDADGIYALSKCEGIIEKCKCDIILTPHSQEMGYLVGLTAEEVETDRFAVSENYAVKNGVTLILKGHHSIITAPDGTQNVNPSGNSGMATAGSGDVLAGMTAALLARGLKPFDASVASCFLHGVAGDKAEEMLGKDFMSATDIIDAIHHILPLEK